MKSNNQKNSLFGVTVFLIVAFCFVTYLTYDVCSMDDNELYKYVTHEPTKPSKGSGVGILLLYNMFGRVGVHIFHWSIVLVAFLCWFLYWKSNRDADKYAAEQEAQKIKAQEEAELAKRRKRFNKRHRGKH